MPGVRLTHRAPTKDSPSIPAAVRERYGNDGEQFIAEFFNALNRLNVSGFNGQLYNVTGLNTPGVSLTRRADFGNPRGTFDPRIGQLALKLVF